jgi:hypothetical protein
VNRYNGLERIAVGSTELKRYNDLSNHYTFLVVMITESLHNDTLWFLLEYFYLRIFLSIEMNRYNV